MCRSTLHFFNLINGSIYSFEVGLRKPDPDIYHKALSISKLINECRKLKIEVDPPDVNVSDINFRPVNKKVISFGLNAIKNVGTKALEQIKESRLKNKKFDSIFDFTANVSLKSVNRRVFSLRRSI